MTFSILCVILLTTAVYKIDAGSCAEQECATGFASWCCSFSSTCGTVGVCNSTIATLRDTRCPGQQACYSYPYYWCCANDQTCGGYATCKGGSTYNALMILRYVGIGFSVLAICLGLCSCIIRHNRQSRSNNQIIGPVRNPGARAQPYSFTNMGRPTQPGPLQSPFPTPMGSGQITENQQAPPPYYTIPLPSTGNGESKI